MKKSSLHLKGSNIESLDLSVVLDSSIDRGEARLANDFDILAPTDPTIGVAPASITVSGVSSSEIKRVWAYMETTLLSVSSGDNPWDWPSTPGTVSFVPGTGGTADHWAWSVSGLIAPFQGGNRLLVWCAFSHSCEIIRKPWPFELIASSGSGSGGPGWMLVSQACSVRGGVPSTLHLTIDESDDKALVGKTVKLQWNKKQWVGELEIPRAGKIFWTLEAVRACKECKPGDFQLSVGRGPVQSPSEANCNPFELCWTGKDVIRLGPHVGKHVPKAEVQVRVSE